MFMALIIVCIQNIAYRQFEDVKMSHHKEASPSDEKAKQSSRLSQIDHNLASDWLVIDVDGCCCCYYG